MGLRILSFTVLIAWLGLTYLSASGQDVKKRSAFKVRLVKLNGDVVRGRLLSIGASMILLQKKSPKKDQTLLTVPAADIKRMTVRKKGKVVEGALIGGATGFLTGFIIGYASYDCPDCILDSPSLNGLESGIPVAIGGFVIGIVVGSIGQPAKIYGEQEKFDTMHMRLKSKKRFRKLFTESNWTAMQH